MSRRMSSSRYSAASLRYLRYREGVLPIKSQRAFSGEAIRKEYPFVSIFRMPRKKASLFMFVNTNLPTGVSYSRDSFVVIDCHVDSFGNQPIVSECCYIDTYDVVSNLLAISSRKSTFPVDFSEHTYSPRLSRIISPSRSSRPSFCPGFLISGNFFMFV